MPDTYTRRAVTTGLLGVVLAMAAGHPVSASPGPLHLYDFAIAGGFFHGLEEARDALRPGEVLVLAPEPDNLHDANAVAVHRADGCKLGYIPREANEPVARLLAAGRDVQATVVDRLMIRRVRDIPNDLVFTGFNEGDPRIRLVLNA